MTSGSHYKAVPIAANSTVIIPGSRIGGFVCTTAGTLTITRVDDGVSTVILNALPVTAGLWVDLPFYVGTNERATATTAGGAVGTLAVS